MWLSIQLIVTWPKIDSDHLLVTPQEMAKLEAQMFSGGMPIEALMEKASISASEWFLGKADLLNEGVIVLVGPGHNGGDGLVVARELHLSGIDVSIWCPFDISKTLTLRHLEYARFIGIKQLSKCPDSKDQHLWIDALFGVGQSRPLPKSISSLFHNRKRHHPNGLISLDVPSGLCSDSGIAFEGGAAYASYTLTIGLIKKGLLQDSALENVGKLVRIDIGIPEFILRRLKKRQILTIYSSDINTLKMPQAGVASHKYERGRLWIVAGSDKYRGAALLALKGALASGVGSIHASLPVDVSKNIWQVIPEIVLRGSIKNDSLGHAVLSDIEIQDGLKNTDALLIGPGLGRGFNGWDFIKTNLLDFDGLLILDADAINKLSTLSDGIEWLKKRRGKTWLTPHPGEFARLFPRIDLDSPLEAAIRAAELTGASIVLKGAHSVIASPEGVAWQLFETGPWSARIGLGDLLAGFVSGIGAVGWASEKNASAQLLSSAVFLHSESAIRAPNGSSATAICETLAKLIKKIQAENVDLETFFRRQE